MREPCLQEWKTDNGYHDLNHLCWHEKGHEGKHRCECGITKQGERDKK